ncbi:metallophosphoesterase [Scrofimicrobium sp. R131]|uniref:Metallophosphoesterase n=1 Tax=Scrofimicrobium appendicitidis TaxID=3079930 RepID=A0AAU7V748_9ACTO
MIRRVPDLGATFQGSLVETGRQPSIVPPRVVGAMRRLALTGAIATGLSLGTLAYAHWESRQPVLRRYQIPVAPREGFTRLRILHVSDLHMFPGQEFITRFLRQVSEREEIDLVISTGDNLGDADSLDQLLAAYEPLLAYPGAFVLGSNDYYSPQTKSWISYLKPNRSATATKRHRRTVPDLPWMELVEHLGAAGWKDLSNRSDSILVQDQALTVALMGVDDPHIRRDRMPTPPASWLEPGAVRLGLTHAPYLRVVNEMVREQADLVLAGHTHGGQVRVPGLGAVITNSDLPRQYASGMHVWGDQPAGSGPSWLHVSAGLGTSPFAPIRFACPPEASLIELVPAD